MRSDIFLDSISVTVNRADYFFSVSDDLKSYFNTNKISIEYSDDISAVPESMLTIPFISAVMPLVWLTDSQLWVNRVDKRFYRCLDRLRNAFQNKYPEYPLKGELVAAYIDENTYIPQEKAAMLFSGGVDAYTTYWRIRDLKPTLIYESIWNDESLSDKNDYSGEWENVNKACENHGLQGKRIRSNIGSALNMGKIDARYSKKIKINYWYGLAHSLIFLGSALVVAFINKAEALYIASSKTRGHKWRIASDPTTDNEIEAASCRVIHDGFELTRTEKIKTLVIAKETTGYTPSIHVCFKNDVNCCCCEKCLRTMLGIAAEGGDPRDFGFQYTGILLDRVKEFIASAANEFTDNNISKWNLIVARMSENYDNVLSKDVADYLLSISFKAEKKKYLRKYYKTNFFKIIKRRVFGNESR